MKTRIAVFLSSRSDIPEAYLPAAREVGEWIGRTGRTLVYGGARRGQMEVLAQAVRQSGGRVVGVVPDILVQRHLESDAVQVAFYTAGLDDRKATMRRESDVIVALPGGIGTLDEVFTALAENTIGTANHQTILSHAGGCWDAMLAMLRQMVSDHLADAEVVERIAIATTTDDLERLCQ